MKIIDILNKIARGEEPPKKIIFKSEEYEYVKKDYYNFDEGWLFDEYVITEILNDEVEILQITIHNEKKIEKLDVKGTFTKNQKKIANKINEIIDHIQE